MASSVWPNSSELIQIAMVFREPASVRFSVFSFVLLVYVLTVTANSLLCVAILRDHQLHRPMYVLMAALAFTDLVENTNALPRTMYDLVVSGPSYISVPWCIVKMFAYHLSFRVHAYILMAMAIDRYVAVCRPLAYHRVASNAITLRALAFIVALSATQGIGFVLITVNLDLCHPRILLTSTCDFLGLRTLSCNNLELTVVYSYSIMSVGLLLPLFTIMVLYGLILRECRRPGHGRGKALQTCGTHLLVVATYFGAIFLTFVSGVRAPADTPTSKEITVALQSLQFLLPPALNPIIYGLRTAEVKNSILRFLRRRVVPRKPPVSEVQEPHGQPRCSE